MIVIMARLAKHTYDIDVYKKKLEQSYQTILEELSGSVAELSDAKSYYAHPEEVGKEDAKLLRVIDTTDLKIACDDMKRLMESIKMKFTKKD